MRVTVRAHVTSGVHVLAAPAAEVGVPLVQTHVGEGGDHLPARLVSPRRVREVSGVTRVRHVIRHVIERHALAGETPLPSATRETIHWRDARAVGGVDQAPENVAHTAAAAAVVGGAVEVSAHVRVLSLRHLAQLVRTVELAKVRGIQGLRSRAPFRQAVVGADQLLQLVCDLAGGAAGVLPVAG